MTNREMNQSESKKSEGLIKTKKISKEELIIALLKSKRSIAELFNNNLDDNKINDIKKILNRLTDMLTKEYKKKIKKKLYEIENKKNLSEQEKK